MRSVHAILALALLAACGPSAAERQAEREAAQARRECGRTYASMTKAYQDQLYAMGRAEVEFVDRDKYLDKCVEMSLDEQAMRCADPNLKDGPECQALPESTQASLDQLEDLLLSPMKDPKASEGAAEGAAAGGEAPATEAPATEGAGTEGEGAAGTEGAAGPEGG